MRDLLAQSDQEVIGAIVSGSCRERRLLVRTRRSKSRNMFLRQLDLFRSVACHIQIVPGSNFRRQRDLAEVSARQHRRDRLTAPGSTVLNVVNLARSPVTIQRRAKLPSLGHRHWRREHHVAGVRPAAGVDQQRVPAQREQDFRWSIHRCRIPRQCCRSKKINLHSAAVPRPAVLSGGKRTCPPCLAPISLAGRSP